MINKSKFIIVSSKKVKSELIKYGAKTHQTKIINFGIPNDMLTTSKRSPKKYFLFVGVNQKIKNIKFIINRFKEFLKFKKDYKLILVLNNFIKSNNKNIKILSNISRQRLQKLYLSANAYLSASYYESFNFPILEALSQKCPVISLKSSVIPEMQKYVNIANNSKEFLKLMQRSVNNDLKTVNINVIKRKFSWNNYVKKLYLLFNRNDKILK
jgi:glycosyltransferase involved in cell wall biosynthesis